MIVQQAASALGMQTDLMATHQCAKAVTLLNYLTPPPCTSSGSQTRWV